MATINSGSIGGMYLQIDYTVTQNISNNTSTVRATLKLVDHYALYMSTMGGSYLSVGGQKVDYSKTISYGGSSTTTTTLYGPRDFVISHNSDGTASCNLTGTFVMNGTYRNSSVGTMTVNQTITLPKIARASGIDKFTNTGGANLTSTNTGESFRVYWTPASSAFKFRVQCLSPGGIITYPSGTTFFEPKSTSSYYTTIATGHHWLPSQTSHRMEVKLYTYDSAGNPIGSAQTSYLTLNVPSHIGPSIGSFVVESVDGMNGLSIRGRSRVRLTANATPGDGAASMATYTFNGNNVNEADGSSSRVVYNPANSSVINTGVLHYTGAASYTVTVADMRGRTASASLGIEVFEYSPPAITSMSVQRCDANGSLNENGTYAYVTVNSQYTTLHHNNTNYNSRTVVLTNSANNLSVTIQNTDNTNNSWSGVYGNGAFTTGSTHNITATIKDTAYGYSANMTHQLNAAARPMNIKSNGKGIGLGKMAETDNLLDVGWDERVRGNLQVDGALTTGNINGVNVGLDNYILGGSRDNITDENWVANAPSFIGTYSHGDYWFSTLSVRHRNGREDGTNYGMQLRSILTQPDNLSWRQHLNGSWGGWKTLLDSSNTADYVVEQGTQGDWTYRKWNSGFAECWRNVSVTPGNVNANNSIQMDLPFTFANTNYNVTITPAKAAMYVDRWGDCETNGSITHTTTKFTMSYNYAFSTAYAVSFNIVVNGKWK